MTAKNAHLIEFHILQSFPATCLNRDDVNAPKSCMVGGVPRARVSSQCWKRQVRLELHNQGVVLGVRTKVLLPLFVDALLKEGASEPQAQVCSQHIVGLLPKDTVMFIGKSEVEAFAQHAASVLFDPAAITAKELSKVSKKALRKGTDSLDIALFGRMVAAKDLEMDVEASCSFSHAISTHKVVSEMDFFTAIDDDQSVQGSAHMGANEFNSATYYRYVSLDVGQLSKTMEPDQLRIAIKAFVHALFLAVPAARQKTFAGYGTWDYAQVILRAGQPVQASFEAPIRATEKGFLGASIDHLRADIAGRKRVFGSLFQERWSCEVSPEHATIDELVQGLISHIED